MNEQLDALLALQAADDGIQALETRLTALTPKLTRLDAERQATEKAIAAARAALEREETRHHDLSERAGEFRRMNERALGQVDKVSKAAHLNAANSQVDLSRRALSDAEAELHGSGQRMAALTAALQAAEERVGTLETEQAPEREQVRAAREQIEREMSSARAGRAQLATHVEAKLLSQYDRVRSRRRSKALFPLHNFTCGNCDNAIPTQRRAGMTAGQIAVCESCGVLLYAVPAPTPAAAGSAH